MRNLTLKQENFCQAIADGMNQSDAYRHAYDAENMRPETLWVKSSELASGDKVSVRIEALRQIIQERATMMAAWHLDKQIRESANNLDGARGDHQWGAANGALQIIGRLTGTLVERREAINVNVSVLGDMSLAQLEARSARLTELLEGLDGVVVEGEVTGSSHLAAESGAQVRGQ